MFGLVLGLSVFLAVDGARKSVVIDCDGVSDDVRAITFALQNPNIEVSKEILGSRAMTEQYKQFKAVKVNEFRFYMIFMLQFQLLAITTSSGSTNSRQAAANVARTLRANKANVRLLHWYMPF